MKSFYFCLLICLSFLNLGCDEEDLAYAPENGGVLSINSIDSVAEDLSVVVLEDSYAEYRDWYQDQVDDNNLYYCNFPGEAPDELQQYKCDTDRMGYYITYYNNYKETIGWFLCGEDGVEVYAIPCNYNIR